MTRSVQLLVAIAMLAGCGGQTAAGRVSGTVNSDVPALTGLSAAERKDVAELRRVTAPFQVFDRGVAAGWSTKITAYMTDPAGAGGMGFHYGNTALIDGTVSVDQPELLLYEPEQNGRLRLVAVEYIIPYTAVSRDAAPPVLFGQKFQQNDVFQLWGLHVWAWKDNPSGLYANWNPRVTCDHTTDVAPAMAHN